jgi:hypothetical protein
VISAMRRLQESRNSVLFFAEDYQNVEKFFPKLHFAKAIVSR